MSVMTLRPIRSTLVIQSLSELTGRTFPPRESTQASMPQSMETTRKCMFQGLAIPALRHRGGPAKDDVPRQP